AQFVSVVFKIFVNAVQFPAEKELLSFLDPGELRGQFTANSPTDPIRGKTGTQGRAVHLHRFDYAHLFECEFQQNFALAGIQSKRKPMTAPALVTSLNLAAH